MKFNRNTLRQENVPERQGGNWSRMNMLLKSGWHCEFLLVTDRTHSFWNWHAWKRIRFGDACRKASRQMDRQTDRQIGRETDQRNDLPANRGTRSLLQIDGHTCALVWLQAFLLIWHRVTGKPGISFPELCGQTKGFLLQKLCASRAIFENGAGSCKEIIEIGVSDGLLHIFLVCLWGGRLQQLKPASACMKRSVFETPSWDT